MKESWQTWSYKHLFNLFPAFRGTGGRVIGISHDFKRVEICLRLNWRTRNYVGTIYGGSMYGAVDPMYMLMLIKILGEEYIIWDKAASIRFIKPGRSTLYATFTITDEEIKTIKELADKEQSIDRHYTVDLVDKVGVIHAKVEKIIYIRKKEIQT